MSQGRVLLGATTLLVLLTACGGSSNSPGPAPAPPPPPPPVVDFDLQHRVSAPSPFSGNCEGAPQTGTVFTNAEVEPSLAVNPGNSSNLVGLWQQDRWSNGSARALLTGMSTDSGLTWVLRPLAFSRCAGGTAGNGGDFQRASDPWVSFGADGSVHAMALTSSGDSFQPGSVNAMSVMRSTDGGQNWSNAITLIQDGSDFFNDKNAITADPMDARFVYAVWDRLVGTGGGPAYLARSSNGGISWESARPIFDPGVDAQTIGNVVAVLPDGTVVDLFTRIDRRSGQNRATVELLRSTDKGLNWSAPIVIADLLSVGARDPETGTVIRDGSLLTQIAVAPNGDLFVVWQDARFSNGVRDGIALARSTNGGLTWSAPQQINRSVGVAAFTPKVHVRADGVIGVSHYDLRSNTADAATLPTDYWLLRSADAVTWAERRIAGPFDLAIAPNARGLFLGDYQALESIGNRFIAFFVQTNAGNTGNRTDVFSAPQTTILSQLSVTGSHMLPATAMHPVPDAGWRQRVHDNIVWQMEQRVPGWFTGMEARRAAAKPR